MQPNLKALRLKIWPKLLKLILKLSRKEKDKYKAPWIDFLILKDPQAAKCPTEQIKCSPSGNPTPMVKDLTYIR